MNNKKRQWASQQLQLLESIKTANKQKNWKIISKTLLKKGYKRTEQECRHKWVNCLSPEINHQPWTDEELRILYTQYNKNLSRWSVIQKLLPNRTQIKIKNHFYGVLRNIVRFVLKHFRKIPGRETEASNKINPNTLKSIYWGQGQFQFMKIEVQNVISMMKYRFNKQKLLKFVSNNEKLYQEFNQKILQESKICLKFLQHNLEAQEISQKIESIPKNPEKQSQNLIAHSQNQHLGQPTFSSTEFNIQFQYFPQFQYNQISRFQNTFNQPQSYQFYYCWPVQNFTFQEQSRL